ncbi:MAG: hypothetical protein WCX46_00480 [Candidatus Paceibacterota bacterium]
MDKLNWSAPEYDDKQKNNDWFWALGVIIVAGSITAIIFTNYFFAALLVIGGILLGFFSTKKPEIIEYELNNKGLKIKDHFYPYEKIKAFFVQTDSKPLLFIKSERFFMPIISMPIDYMQAENIYKMMIANEIIEEKMSEHPYEKIMEHLGF